MSLVITVIANTNASIEDDPKGCKLFGDWEAEAVAPLRDPTVLCEVLSAGWVDTLSVVVVEPLEVLAPPAELNILGDTEEFGVVRVETGGKLEKDGIATVLNNEFEVDVAAVASGSIVMGMLNIAQSSATAEKVAAQSELTLLARRGLERTVLVSGVARCNGAVVQSSDVHVVVTETCPLTVTS